mgnify:CR=1 FL=1
MSDFIILTEEDSGEEDTLSICREIASYVEAQGCDYSIEPNRGEAIRRAILSCQSPTVLLITGKGAETRQKRGSEYIDTPSDVDYVHTYLQEYDVSHGLDGMEKVRSRVRPWMTVLLAVFMAVNMLTSALALARYDARTSGEAPKNSIDMLLDAHFDDARMERIYPNAKKVAKAG